eukprot:TRINITY_DN22628_c0_g1_i1.p1 TRINITY_DN22628_c0_g1~~TRINITY_DN22628_c0_g1_i1.p1  ORF type:complete len:319 (-),score=25.61 TRINITY_DN22628_c0_g1_i1:120-1055(-)
MVQFFALVVTIQAMALQASNLMKDRLALHGFMVTTVFVSPRCVQATENIDLGTASPACLLQRNQNTVALEAEEPATSKQIPTCGGNAGGKPCSFPFTSKGVQYTHCITRDSSRPWCFTAEDDWGYCDCGWTTTTTTTTLQTLCSNIAGGVSSTYPCLCGTKAPSPYNQCYEGQSCTASDDNDGVCLAHGTTAPPANYDLVCSECDGCDGRREFIWRIEKGRMQKKQGDFKVLGKADVRDCSMLASADPFCGLYFLVGDGECYCDRVGYSCYRKDPTLGDATGWAYYRRKVPVCSDVAHGASSFLVLLAIGS